MKYFLFYFPGKRKNVQCFDVLICFDKYYVHELIVYLSATAPGNSLCKGLLFYWVSVLSTTRGWQDCTCSASHTMTVINKIVVQMYTGLHNLSYMF